MEDLDVCGCQEEEDLEWHGLVHEAGHAIAALENQIRFRRIILYKKGTGPTFGDGLYRADEEVEMLDRNPTTWIPANPAASLQYLWAGTLAEVELIGHASPNGEKADMSTWHKGLSNKGKLPANELRALLGTSPEDLFEHAQWRASVNRGRVEQLARQLVSVARPHCLSYDDVVAFDRAK